MTDTSAADSGAVSNSDSWRDTMPIVIRQRVCKHVMLKLRVYYRNLSDALLKNKTLAFEAQTFARAISNRDYFVKITNGLANAEKHAKKLLHMASLPVSSPPVAPNADAASNTNSWRADMRRADRVKICRHVMLKLNSFYGDISDVQLKDKTRSLEAEAFSRATSCRKYLGMIAEQLCKAEIETEEDGGSMGTRMAALLLLTGAIASDFSLMNDTGSWRVDTPKIGRVKVCQYINSQLRAIYDDLPEKEVRDMVRELEAGIFCVAGSRREYRTKIQEMLGMCENGALYSMASASTAP